MIHEGDAFLRDDEKSAAFTTKSVLNCLPPETWTKETAPVTASFAKLHPTELQQRILRDWKTGYGRP